jgi:tetratricopeptide (TPR) repeat protein
MSQVPLTQLVLVSIAALVSVVGWVEVALAQPKLDLRPRLNALEARNFQLRLELYRLEATTRQQIQLQTSQLQQQLQQQNSQFQRQLRRLDSLESQRMRSQSIKLRQSGAQEARVTTSRSGANQDWLQRGQRDFARQNYGEALLAFNQAILVDPTDANLYFNRGLVLFELGDVFGAIANFDQAVVYNPRLAPAYRHRGGARFQVGEQGGAIQDLQIAAALFADQGESAKAREVQQLLRQLQQ